jgi:NDP-sugar pyrophosphorylase family protein
LRRNGIDEVYITTGYLGHLIRSVCSDGRQWDMRINYTEEKEALGTIGPIGLLRDRLDETFLVINGDILTDLSLKAFIASHRRHEGALSVATTTRTSKLEFGLIDDRAERIMRFKEKPIMSHVVSMGIYCMEPEVLEHIPNGVPFGFDDLVLYMLDRDKPVYTFRHDGFWLDLGRPEDFQHAQEMDWDDQAPAFETVGAWSTQIRAAV